MSGVQYLPYRAPGPAIGDAASMMIGDLWAEARSFAVAMVRIFCRECSGRKRGTLGTVLDSFEFAGGILEMEIVAPPRVCPANRTRPIARQLPGWHKRGEPDAPQRIALLEDAWDDNDPLPWTVYCARDGLRVVTWGEIRAECARAAQTGRTRNMGV